MTRPISATPSKWLLAAVRHSGKTWTAFAALGTDLLNVRYAALHAAEQVRRDISSSISGESSRPGMNQHGGLQRRAATETPETTDEMAQRLLARNHHREWAWRERKPVAVFCTGAAEAHDYVVYDGRVMRGATGQSIEEGRGQHTRETDFDYIDFRQRIWYTSTAPQQIWRRSEAREFARRCLHRNQLSTPDFRIIIPATVRWPTKNWANSK